MRPPSPSIPEREFLLSALRQSQRLDGRGLLDMRTPTITFNEDLGFAEVSLGNTKYVRGPARALRVPFLTCIRRTGSSRRSRAGLYARRKSVRTKASSASTPRSRPWPPASTNPVGRCVSPLPPARPQRADLNPVRPKRRSPSRACSTSSSDGATPSIRSRSASSPAKW
jgi:hypothetical protein